MASLASLSSAVLPIGPRVGSGRRRSAGAVRRRVPNTTRASAWGAHWVPRGRDGRPPRDTWRHVASPPLPSRHVGLMTGVRGARRRALPVPGPEFVTPTQVFDVENVAIFPFWAAMIAFPDSKVTKAVMGSYAVPILLGAVYVYLTWYSFSDPRILEAFSTGKPDLAALAKGFSYEWCMAVGWAHFIAMDLFVGRWIYLDARKNDVVATHSLLLCLFFGPTGVMSHVATRAVTGAVRGEKLTDVMADEKA